ncbi:MAG: sigma-70 family RNA polymerase sigma factor [Candidatus Eremiobacteraeota bacterium]|nr:sigma-70 family RNA polymerase sigma factor [Candidatus Eremiobacteraeota bacterium]
MQAGDDLFRRESGRIVATLTRIFGTENLALAEDVAQDVFCRALEVWKLRGVPSNPSAWFITAAKRRAIDLLRRERRFRKFAPDLDSLLASEWTLTPTVNAAFSEEAIANDELRMMFACCDPKLSEESRIALILRLLCGFSTREVAHALLSTPAAMEKRIERARKVLTQTGQLFDLVDAELNRRVPAVHRALYLLFSEGYHASSESPVRRELCREAMRLAAALATSATVASAASDALCALMWLDAARLGSRVDANGDLVSLDEQDRSRWNRAMIAKGKEFLKRSATGEVSAYHLEATIAAVHCSAEAFADTDWAQLARLYDALLRLHPSPVVALNRAIAFGYAFGPRCGLDEIRTIAHGNRLAQYPFLPAALAEFESRLGHFESARRHLHAAVALARNSAESRFLERRLAALEAAASLPV